ncbi:MAG TPA: VWA domain-containing protein [Thermomicrobiales bacterium]|nr:VWA domain-containing protein [Thermomicrobiales bacterium]
MALPRYGTRYSRWDGTQQVDDLSAEDLMRAMSDELVRDGDLMNALRRLFWEGVDRPDAERLPGLRDLMNRVRQARQDQMQRYDLSSMLDDIRERIQDVIDTERTGIQQRLDEASQSPSEQDGSQDDASSQQGDGGETPAGAGEGGDQQGLRDLLNSIAEKRNQQLDDLPSDPAGQIRGLQQYDFMDQQARQKFQDLLAQLQQQMMNQTFQGMQQSLSQMSPEQIADTRQMMSELNDMLEAKNRGEDPGFEQFMHKWGHYFGDNIRSLEDLIEHMRQQTAAMQQLMDSMSQEQRSELQGLMQAIMQDPGLQQEMSRMQQNLGQMMRPEDWRRSYDFSGDESLSLQQAMRLMDRMTELDELEREFKDVRDWNDFADLDQDKIQELLGEDTREQMDQLGQLAKILEDAGFIKKTRRGFELTPQGVRKIGEKALTDIFAQLKRDRIGAHEIDRQGGAGERTDASKPYEFGDPFLLDLESTVMNAVQREGRGTPLKIVPSDFEVYRTEYSTRSSTVLMIDMSRSMFYSDSFTSAKRIALALDSLIRSKYPRDTLELVGFSYIAEQLKQADLPTLTWNEYQYGTNMQHGFQLARQMLGRHKGSNRQIIIITDGEPTAHIENGQVYFNWPPMPRTFQETLREVVRCTRDGIKINTFMLERTPMMIEFVNDLMRINGGRVFYATPDRLGEYILVDYVANKRRWVS